MKSGPVRQFPFPVFLGLALAISLVVLFATLNLPITDQHGFRQSQTAISAYWLLHDGPWIDYWTPVLGAPWSIPFEFPLYQWEVATLVKLTGISLDAAGRLVSYLFLLLGIWPALYLIRSYRFPASSAYLYAILLLASPVYLFWGRALLIETQALTLCIAMLALLRGWYVSGRLHLLVFAILAGIAGTLTKITTIIPFLALGFAMMVGHCLAQAGDRRRQFLTLAGAGLAVVPGFVMAVAWNWHADAVKALNPTAQFTLSKNLVEWNFGTVSQRFSGDLFQALLRGVMDVAGVMGLAIFVGAVIIVWKKRSSEPRLCGIFALLVFAWLIPFLVLTNLHIVHNYYQTANAALLIGALALAYGLVADQLTPGKLAVVLLLALISQYARFTVDFVPKIAAATHNRDYVVGNFVRSVTKPGTAVVGLGVDWSPVLPYYAQRKALLLPGHDTAADRSAIQHLPSALGGEPLGAIVECPSKWDDDPDFKKQIRALSAGFATHEIANCVVHFAPE